MRILYHMHMVHIVREWYVPYIYDEKIIRYILYVYGTTICVWLYHMSMHFYHLCLLFLHTFFAGRHSLLFLPWFLMLLAFTLKPASQYLHGTLTVLVRYN